MRTAAIRLSYKAAFHCKVSAKKNIQIHGASTFVNYLSAPFHFRSFGPDEIQGGVEVRELDKSSCTVVRHSRSEAVGMIQLVMQAKEKMLNWMMTSKMQLLFSSICLVSILLAGTTFQAFTSAAASSVTADLDPHRSILQAHIAFAGASFLFSLASASLYTVRLCMISVWPEKRRNQGGNPEDKRIALEDMTISIGPETSDVTNLHEWARIEQQRIEQERNELERFLDETLRFANLVDGCAWVCFHSSILTAAADLPLGAWAYRPPLPVAVVLTVLASLFVGLWWYGCHRWQHGFLKDLIPRVLSASAA